MANPSLSCPDWMDREIERRSPRGLPKSVYIRDALIARFNAEDEGNWEPPEWKTPEEYTETEEDEETGDQPSGKSEGAASDGGEDREKQGEA